MDKESFLSPNPPWLYLVGSDASRMTDYAWSLASAEQPRVAVRVLRGRKMTTPEGLFNEFAAALQFPYYFGENWAAFDECLADLEWLPADAYVLVVTDAQLLLSAGGGGQLRTLVDILQKVAADWSRPADPQEPWGHAGRAFHVIFQSPSASLQEVLLRLKSAGADLSEAKL